METERNVSRATVHPKANIVCYVPQLTSVNGIWQGDNPLDFMLPIFIMQVFLMVATSCAFQFILKPFRQPKVISEILGGIVLGPSVLGQVKNFSDLFFPKKSMLSLETLANLGLIYFHFLVGVEMDLLVIKRMGRKAIVVAFTGIALPFSIGVLAAFFFRNQITNSADLGPFLLFLGVALSVTAFPVLARILAENKLLNTEIGRISMSSAIINDVCVWHMLALAITLADKDESALSALWVLLAGTVYILLCFYVVRPALLWQIRRMPEGDRLGEFHVCILLTGVMLSGFLSDAIGLHAVFGAFIFGLVIPNGRLDEALLDQLGDFATGLLVPLYFAFSGLKTDMTKIRDPVAAALLILVFVLASAGKVAGTVLISMFYNMPFRDGVSLGFLMNTRGLVEMIILNVGREKQVLGDQSFAIMVIMSLVSTAVITPVVTTIHKPAKLLLGYKRRNLQRSKPDAELRMLACIHTPRNVPSMISLLELSNPIKRAPIFVYALHLIELTSRTTAMLVAHSVGSAKSAGSTTAQSDGISVAFEQFEQRTGGISVQLLSAVSPYSTMHEDVCGLAADKHVAFIVLPFHKHQTVDGLMQEANPAIRAINENVFTHAPCSVGILVDRGLGATGIAHRAAPSLHFSHHVAVLFFGGPDDREALAYGWRMAEHPDIGLAVVRFYSSDANPTPLQAIAHDPRSITVTTTDDRERELDDEYFGEFRLKTLSNESVLYIEKVVRSSVDTVAVIRGMDNIYNLYIVGRGQGQGQAAQLTAGLSDWSDTPELGPIGELLTSSDFGATVSVLVVQQYVGGLMESPRRQFGWNGKTL